MVWGFQTWDSAGKPNNYGLVPVTVVGRLPVAFEQVSGGTTFSVPAGYVLDYIQAPTSYGYTQVRRAVNISGGNVTITSAPQTSFGIGTESAQSGFIVFYLRKA